MGTFHQDLKRPHSGCGSPGPVFQRLLISPRIYQIKKGLGQSLKSFFEIRVRKLSQLVSFSFFFLFSFFCSLFVSFCWSFCFSSRSCCSSCRRSSSSRGCSGCSCRSWLVSRNNTSNKKSCDCSSDSFHGISFV